MTQFLQRGWHLKLGELINSASQEITISSPYVTTEGTKFIAENVSLQLKKLGKLQIITNLSPTNICQGITDPSALQILINEIAEVEIRHLPRLHAKVYIADSNQAIITSGNLTLGGLQLNFEYGVSVKDSATVTSIKADINAYANLGAEISLEQLSNYREIADEIKAEYKRTQLSQNKEIKKRFNALVKKAEDNLVSLQLAKGPIHTVFADTIIYLLSKHGKLSTIQIHEFVETIHPDLCDNSVYRVIAGVSRGRKWKHAVRTAQQNLKKAGRVEFENGLWMLT